jgi:hypothetical protein
MTKNLDQIADKAARQIISAYWAACDAAQAAIAPETLTAQRWVIDLLGEAYESALDAEEHPSGWKSGRDM